MDSYFLLGDLQLLAAAHVQICVLFFCRPDKNVEMVDPCLPLMAHRPDAPVPASLEHSTGLRSSLGRVRSSRGDEELVQNFQKAEESGPRTGRRGRKMIISLHPPRFID